MPPSDSRLAAALALTRFGLGARPGEIESVAHDPRAWLDAQVRPQGAPLPQGDFPTSEERIAQFADYRQTTAQARQVRRETPPAAAQPQSQTQAASNEQPAPMTTSAQAAFDARRELRRDLTQDTAQEFLARARLGAETPDGFAERWALFWSNALTVSSTKFQTAVFQGQYEREAIRPHVFGRFEDLLVAAETHPAMLFYLDQAQSVGPDSPAGMRRRAGLNENLAREILELHTVGADGGYTQADVTEFARALTGWTVAGQAGGGQNAQRRAIARDLAGDAGFVFRPAVHEPGVRTVMGKPYPQTGREQGEAILRDLAARPETARRLARRIAAHFVADEPPVALIAKLETAWMRSGGRLDEVARTLIIAPEAWVAPAAKMKTPYDFIISTHRALNVLPRRPQALQAPLRDLGQPAWAPPSPKGWPDTTADWAGPDALVKRMEWAASVADAARGEREPLAIAEAALGPRLSERTRTAVARAESRPEALTLLLMSPEFQRR